MDTLEKRKPCRWHFAKEKECACERPEYFDPGAETFAVPHGIFRFYRASVMCRLCDQVIDIGYQRPVARIVPSDFQAALEMHMEGCSGER